MSRVDYLAKHYLTADKSEKKGKKRKRKEASAGLTIAEDDISGWTTHDLNTLNPDDITATLASGQTAEFRKAKKNNWKTIGAPAPSNAEQAAADAILASAAQEARTAGAGAADDEAPAIVETVSTQATTSKPMKMADGTHVGLQTKEQVAAALAERQAEEQAELAKATAEGRGGAAQETIYRDASGRIINVAMKRAEARRAAEEEARKKREEVEARKGDVQRAEEERKKQDLREAKYMTVARRADDEEMNAELKERERWNDPAAGFLVKKKKGGKSATGKPLYQGSSAPNRYGIRPGHRWDGVDRSNGFEKKYFAARNRKENIRDLEYAWQMDE
ncbi:hypothetical protein EV356DRAFT_531371 [Viridothelium virens]|uniref:Pre-mRNA-splicing factor cwc26 n=1 Tax=Viridothelium virens TaxID=1048519 RepID=A0A6A6HDB3_VIRVR|nr:hypothetical protein EV356DRAFT_531371 [Viridothelium virens]